MARLQVFRHGEKIKELELIAGKEWLIGRASSCDLILDGERGISRQHLKLVYESGAWKVEVLSRFGELYFNGQKVTLVPLSGDCQFEVPPFLFHFQESPASDVSVDSSTDLLEVPNAIEAPVLQKWQPDPEPLQDPSDRTFVGRLPSHAYLRVCDHQDQAVQIFRMEGQHWIAGRDTASSLFIDNIKFSRRHFEIRLEEGAYLVKDLGSSNGTFLNGDLLSTTDWTALKSGDVLSVVDWKLYFEIRDSSFDEKLQEIPHEFRQPMVYVEPDAHAITPGQLPSQYIVGQAAVSQASAKKTAKKTNWVRMLIYLVVVGGAVAFFKGQQPKEQAPVAATNTNSSPFEKLTGQQQQYVRDTYRLADRLFKEGRYEMARQEVAKIHELIPYYEESKNLEKLADIAIQTQIEQQRAEVREREQAEMEEKIKKTIALCNSKVDSNIEMQEIDDCLMPIIPLNPDHPGITSLKAKVDHIISQRTERAEQAAEYRARVNRHKSLFQKAEALREKGKFLEAIPAYETVVGSRLPDPGNLKSEAKRQIASIQKDLIEKQSIYEREAEEAQKKGDLKTAILTLKKAMTVNPENESLKGRINSLISELRKQMQVLYQEGVLEESVGEVETAKARWKKIVEQSVPEEDYYKKARSKLKKYGFE